MIHFSLYEIEQNKFNLSDNKNMVIKYLKSIKSIVENNLKLLFPHLFFLTSKNLVKTGANLYV